MSLLDVVSQLSLVKISRPQVKICVSPGCTSPRHTGRSGTQVKRCKKCMNEQSKESRIRQNKKKRGIA